MHIEKLLSSCFGKPFIGEEGKPTLHYFAICGRGELARLICAVGGGASKNK